MNELEKCKCRNVAFCVSEELISEIDKFCEEKGGVPRKEWLFNLISEKNKLKNDFELISKDYTALFKENEKLRIELKDNQKVYSELFTSTLRYRTFFRRLKNLFSKF